MEEKNLRAYAHLGDAVWELYIREQVIEKTQVLKKMHALTTEYVCAKYQAEKLQELEIFLTEEEKELSRRARNLQVPIARRSNQSEYRQATAFEALIGWWYLNDKEHLKEILTKIN